MSPSRAIILPDEDAKSFLQNYRSTYDSQFPSRASPIHGPPNAGHAHYEKLRKQCTFTQAATDQYETTSRKNSQFAIELPLRDLKGCRPSPWPHDVPASQQQSKPAIALSATTTNLAMLCNHRYVASPSHVSAEESVESSKKAAERRGDGSGDNAPSPSPSPVSSFKNKLLSSCQNSGHNQSSSPTKFETDCVSPVVALQRPRRAPRPVARTGLLSWEGATERASQREEVGDALSPFDPSHDQGTSRGPSPDIHLLSQSTTKMSTRAALSLSPNQLRVSPEVRLASRSLPCHFPDTLKLFGSKATDDIVDSIKGHKQSTNGFQQTNSKNSLSGKSTLSPSYRTEFDKTVTNVASLTLQLPDIAVKPNAVSREIVMDAHYANAHRHSPVLMSSRSPSTSIARLGDASEESSPKYGKKVIWNEPTSTAQDIRSTDQERDWKWLRQSPTFETTNGALLGMTLKLAKKTAATSSS